MAAKITMIIPTLVQGGAEKQMSLLAAGLPKSEFDVRVIALTSGGPWHDFLNKHGIPVTVIGKRFKFDPFSFWSLYRELKRKPADLVHTWIFAANSYGRLAAKLARIQYQVAGERCVDLWKSEFHFMIDRYLDRWTTAFATNSQGVVDFYQRHRIGRDRFHVIPNGSLPQGQVDPHARQQWRQRLGLATDAVIATSLARLWPQKRLKDLIWAIDLLNCKYDHVHLVIAGDGPERQRLQQFALEAKVDTRVHFVGHLTETDSLLQASDLFCLVSEYEGQSNSLMEAIHWRIPAVVTDIPGNRDLIPDGDHGYICPIGDRIAIAKQMAAVLDDPVGANARAERASLRLQAVFDPQAMIDGYASLYRSILQQAN
jgi:glycosyltransferase involved in cell wall biosynthesis